MVVQTPPQIVEELTASFVVITLRNLAYWLGTLPDDARTLVDGNGRVIVEDAHLASQFLRLALMSEGHA